MGGMMHLFDFNQALAGRRSHADKKYSEGLDDPRNSLEPGVATAEAAKTSATTSDEIPFGYEIRKNSPSKRSNGMPIRASISQELSKEPDPKSRAPNVVARLMGLEALPADPNASQKSKCVVAVEKPVPKLRPERQQQEPKSQHSVKLCPKKFQASGLDPLHEPSVLQGYQHHGLDLKMEKSDPEAFPFCKHPQEKQLQEFKKEFEVWQSQKLREPLRSARLDELDMQVANKEVLVHAKSNETKAALAHEKIVGLAERAIPQEKLHESKEFLDAMDFLQSNRDFFLRILREPNSLFASHLQDCQSDPRTSSQPTPALKQKWSDNVFESYNSRKEEDMPKLPGKDFSSRNSVKIAQHSENRLGAALGSEKDMVLSSTLPPLVTEESRRPQNQELCNDSWVTEVDCQVPTRIVVLKPSAGRNRNLRLSSQNCSPRTSTSSRCAKEVISDDAQHVLLELRERLRKGTREARKGKEGKRQASQNIHNHCRDSSRGPKEIAREIARQVRESVTRDLEIDSGMVRSVHSTPNGLMTGKRVTQRRTDTERADNALNSDAETLTQSKRIFGEHQSKSSASLTISPQYEKSLDSQVVPDSKEGRKRGIEKPRMLQTGHTDEEHLQEQNIVMRKGGYFEDDRPTLPQLKVSDGSKQQQASSLAGFKDKQSHWHADSIKSDRLSKVDAASNWDETMVHTPSKICEESKDSSPRTLSRSRSVPHAPVTAERSQVDNVKKAGLCEAGAKKGGIFTNELKTNKNSTTVRSLFSRRVSGLKGSFSLGRKRAPTKELPDQISLLDEGSVPLEFQEDSCTSSQEFQSKMEDVGAAVNWDSVRPISENCFVLEQAHCIRSCVAVNSQTLHISEKGTFTHKNVPTKLLEVTARECQAVLADCKHEHLDITATLSTPKDSSCGITASGSSLCSLVDESLTGATETGKEKFDQPSPVSVLDSPFQEEIASPAEFKKFSSELREPRLRIRLLKFDDQGMPGPDLVTMQKADGLLINDGSCNHGNFSKNTASVFDTGLSSNNPPGDFERTVHEGIDKEKLGCAKGRESEMMYVKNTLIASGFTDDSTIIFTNWYSPNHPLDPHLFSKIEDFYCCKQSVNVDGQQTNNENCTHKGQGMLDTIGRHLLFDCVNEVLLEILGPHMNLHTCMKPHQVTVRSIPIGRELVNCIWMEVFRLSHSQSEPQDTLENLVAKDLARSGLWMDLTEATEIVGLELERAIFNDLIEETIIDIVSH